MAELERGRRNTFICEVTIPLHWAREYAQRILLAPGADPDLIETHDAFTISDLQTYGDVGLTLYGREQDYVTSGECYHTNPHTGRPSTGYTGGGRLNGLAPFITSLPMVRRVEAWALWTSEGSGVRA